MEMEEQKTIERPLMSEEEFKDYMEKSRVGIVGDFYGKGILPLMNEEESKDHMEKNRVDIVGDSLGDFYGKGIPHLRTYEAVSKFKSVRRAIRRGHVSLDGIIFPKRPFNNKANTCKRKGHHSRTINERKKMIYEQLKHRKSA